MRSPERSGTVDLVARPNLAPSTVALLAGLSLLLVFLALEPYLSYALFGSDSGEYYRLTTTLLATGHLPTGGGYSGWGTAYPDFPGMFLVAGGASGALGISAYSALTILIPVVAVLSVLPLFLLFRRLYPNDTVALLGAAIASIAMPRLFSIAHPAPLALGDFLCVAALWMFVEGRQDRRWYVPLALTSGALIVTHHLSSYFFIVSALGGLVLLELWRPGVWSRRFPARELAFVALFVTGTFAYWFYGTTSFVTKVILYSLPFPTYVGFAAFEAGALAAVAVAAGLIRWRRARSERPKDWVRLPSDTSLVRDAAVIVTIVFGLVGVLLFVPIPGTGQTTVPTAVLWFTPLLALGLFGAGARRTPSLARLGSFPLAWLGALGLSAGTMLALAAFAGTNPKYAAAANLAATISPSRHAEYLFLPLGLILAIGIARAVARLGDARGRRMMFAAMVGVVVLLGANAAIVYPPSNDLGGFQEGLTHGDAALWLWVGIAAPPTWTVASDHRLSSMIFGFDGNPATWVTTPALFTGNDPGAAAAELRSVGTPNPAAPHPIDLVVVDSVMYSGVALDPAQKAAPLSSTAILWFEGVPFVPLYEDGLNVVYLVDAPEIPAAL
ncbi:MAG: hypothetical protein L3J92_05185 [Thermoplasmata archaeon]|jgi:hypothetical protein|nr:hypothetical protein [Thermoplasmata archaeon]